MLQTFVAQGSGDFLVHNVLFWFLPCLFVIEVLYYMIDKFTERANITVCILLSVLGACMISLWRGPFILLLWSMETTFVSILFYGAGNWSVKRWGLIVIQERVLSKKGLSLVIMIVLTLVMINTAHWNGHISLGSDSLGKYPPMFYLIAFMGIFTTGLFSILVCSIKREIN